MLTRKPRILMCNDAHFLYTGFGKYGKNVLSRLAKTGKYELAELACYGHVNDERDHYGPWRYYANSVPKTSRLIRHYESHPQNEFGRWRFETVCLDFKPDIVWDIRDPWMLAYQYASCLRPFYHWMIMPTVDSAPQQEEWLDIFMDADSVLNYTNFGQNTLNKESNNHINTCGLAPPGVDLDVFYPVHDKKAHRAKIGFYQDANIIGTIMRNQSRKLYPDLFEAFRKFIDKCYDRGERELAENTYLYVHCSYPDVGWDIPHLLRQTGLGRKVIFTYICKNCGKPSMTFFRDARAVCPHCSHAAAVLPNPDQGLQPQQLASVLNIFDAYIQYAVCEGFGMPQVEAAACGVPVMAVNYSAMEDVIKNTKGTPLKVERMFHDTGTNALRALPDNDYCAEKIYEFFQKPSQIRSVAGRQARKGAEKHYNWDKTAKIMEEHIDGIELTGLQGKWYSPMRPCGKIPPMPDPSKITNPVFVDWLVKEVAKEPQNLNTRTTMKLLRQLNYGVKQSGRDIERVDRQKLYEMMANYAKDKVHFELIRTGQLQANPVDYVEYAHQREKYLK